MTDAVLFRRFCDSPALGIDEAMQGIAASKPSIPWRDYLQNSLNVLSQVPAVDLESASEQDEGLLVRVRDLCDRHLKMLRSSRT